MWPIFCIKFMRNYSNMATLLFRRFELFDTSVIYFIYRPASDHEPSWPRRFHRLDFIGARCKIHFQAHNFLRAPLLSALFRLPKHKEPISPLSQTFEFVGADEDEDYEKGLCP
ncbi:hypothetical protein NDU88_001764 [Pleurodeles waltl]|uniref:Uncharacterized protein n=1 Tax=Pleurodeles waltl TaxID=8319 RepID=A0AAV7LH00_PLEWA|nr:hypothetical protein NDU88_001764 [Pleurodeles waltl]